MAEQGVRSNYSLCPFEIEMCDDQGGISSATGFIYDQNGDLFLITNWHNFAGRDPFTGNPLENQSVVRFPTFIKAKLASVVNPPSASSDGIAAFVARRIDIYEDYEPRWFEHPILGHQCDVVALPLDRPNDRPDHFHKAVNLMDSVRIPVLPGGGFTSSDSRTRLAWDQVCRFGNLDTSPPNRITMSRSAAKGKISAVWGVVPVCRHSL